MIKKILPISIFVLLVVVIVLLGLQNLLNKNNSRGNSNITPTLFQGQQASGSTSQTGKIYVTNPNGTTTEKPMTSEDFQRKLPIIAPDFTLDYSKRLQKYVVTLKNDKGQEAYNQWFDQNSSFDAFLPPENIIKSEQSVEELHAALDYANNNVLSPEQAFKKNTDSILSIVNILFSPLSNIQQSTQMPTVAPTSTPIKPTAIPKNPQTDSGKGKYIYYSQCGGPYDEYLLPIQNGAAGKKCTICSAGCGPTTAAMILSSYVDSAQTPPRVVDAMGKAGVEISCNGSGMYDIYDYMSNISGIKVSSLIDLGHGEAKEVIGDFRSYIKTGWTLFVLADCTYGGHYFWVTDVTTDGNILAYDPAYGVGKPTPFNENQYDPHPYYIYAFAVKKS